MGFSAAPGLARSRRAISPHSDVVWRYCGAVWRWRIDASRRSVVVVRVVAGPEVGEEDTSRQPSAVKSRSGPFRLFETICRDLLVRLSPEQSERSKAFTIEARELLMALERWEREPPTEDQRAAIISRVMDLHRTAMDHLTVGVTKPSST